jgi:signal transduction histidine kinase
MFALNAPNRHILRLMAAESGSELHFPDVRKLELDELIDQLVDRAEGVKRAQGRLRTLLHAIETVTGDLSLEAVLRNIVDAARTLAAAKYGALGVIGYDGGLEQFIHVGMDDATVRRIGDLPQGKGLLGALITDPKPIRLPVMSDDQRSAGFPPDHPPMNSFLGVPIRVRGQVFGNLYLTDSANGEFSAEDEELVNALALAAGTAVTNARLYDESRLQQRWLSASVEIGAQVLAATGEDPLRMIARRAFDIADADVVSVGLLTADGTELVVETAFGEGAAELIAQRFRLSESLAGRAVDERKALLLKSADSPDRTSHLATILDVGPVMVLPLIGSERVRGVLSMARERGRRSFTPSDLNMAGGFANHASVALELADARASEQRIVLLEDRERIARDLHDHVIQELFAIGLSLESAAALIGPDHPATQRVQQRVADIDRTIRQIRTSIFELRGPLAAPAEGLRKDVLSIAADLTPALGFSPGVTFGGPVDVAMPADLADDVVACVREGLTNIAKHAHASRANVDITLTADDLTLTVTDNGVGITQTGRISGLANLRERAAKHGGSFDISTGLNGGATLTWTIPTR